MSSFRGLVFASLAGLIIFGTLEAVMPVFQIPERLQGLSGNLPNDVLLEIRRETNLANSRNASFALGLLGCVVASILSCAELFHRQMALRAIWGGVLAGLVAALVGAAAGAAGAAVAELLDLPEKRLLKTTVVQTLMLTITGVGIGLALPLPMFRWRLTATCMAACLLGGSLAGLIFPVAASLLLPHLNTDLLLPDKSLGRLLWISLPAVLIGLTVGGLGKERATKP